MKKIISAATALAMTFLLSFAANARFVGDVNKDNEVNSLDALEVLLYSVGQTEEIDSAIADVNKDGEVNSVDALDIINIAVGSYEGELEIEDDVLVTSYKRDVVDPVLQTGEFTIQITVIQDGTPIPATIMVRGNDMSVDITYDKVKCRMLVLGTKNYIIFPDLMVCAEAEELSLPLSFSGGINDEYVKSEYVTISGKTYVCETYQSKGGGLKKYYFLDGVWKATETVANGSVEAQRIDDFYAGIKESNFSTSGYFKVSDLNNYLK